MDDRIPADLFAKLRGVDAFELPDYEDATDGWPKYRNINYIIMVWRSNVLAH